MRRERLLAQCPNFETVDQAVKEDRLRLERLGWVLPVESLNWTNIGTKLRYAAHRFRYRTWHIEEPAFDATAIKSLMEKLNAGIADPAASFSLASSVSMRNVRIKVFGALFEALDGYADDDLHVVTVVKDAWVVSPRELMALDGKAIKSQFQQDLKRTGVSSHPDPLVGFLHGEFEPTRGVFVLHFHLVTTRAKAEVLAHELRRLPKVYRRSDTVPRPIRCPKLNDRSAQITYLLKAFWPQRTLRETASGWKRDRDYRRVCEPWSSLYLLWLDRHSLRDLTIENNTWSRRKGGSAAWRNFYLSVDGALRTTASDG